MPWFSRNGQGAFGGVKLPQARDFGIILLFAIAIAVIVCRLVFVQVIMAGEYSQLADKSHMVDVDVPAKRGTIYDRNGEVLASSIEATTIYVDPTEVSDPSSVASVLEEHLGSKYEKSYRDYYSLVTMRDTSFAYIQRKCDKDVAKKLRADLKEKNLIGIHYLEDTKRVYPNEDAGRQVVGNVDVDGNGIAGLEMQYDELVGGTDGHLQMERGGGDIPVAGAVISEEESTDGKDIVTSVDIRLQQKAEERLKKTLKKYDAQGGSVTIMDASNGELYAACSLKKDEDGGKTAYTQDVGKIWSVSDAYEPGSTFKALTASSILANSKVTAKSSFTVPGSLKVYDATITDSHDHGTEEMSFRQIIAESSNIGTVLAARKVKNDQLYKTYTDFGFGSSPGTDFPGTSSGLLEQPKDWDGVQAANITFGQGVLVTGLQLIRAYGALEQDGTMHVPHFLVDVPLDAQKSAELTGPLHEKSQASAKKNANSVTSMLKSVVSSGTGEAAAIEKFTVAGKTGTAEVADNTGRYGAGYIVSFCGWLEGSSSDLVCLVTVEKPKTEEGGGDVCGPAFADIMQFAIERYQISPDSK